jgi:predicted ATP-dependent serine protease
MSKYIRISGTSNSGKTQTLVETMAAKLQQGKSCLFICGEENPVSILGRLSKLIDLERYCDTPKNLLGFSESEEVIFGTVAYDCVFLDSNKEPRKHIGKDCTDMYYSYTLPRKRV